jgi:hypothetical protein
LFHPSRHLATWTTLPCICHASQVR